MGKNKRLEFISAFFGLAYGLFFLIGSFFIDARRRSGDIGSAFMPRLVGIGIVLLSAIYLLMLLKQRRKDEPKNSVESKQNYKIKGVVLTTVSLVAYALLMRVLGFVVTSTLYLFAQMMILATNPTKKQIIFYAVISIVVPILVYYIFTEGFSLLLPAGILM